MQKLKKEAEAINQKRKVTQVKAMNDFNASRIEFEKYFADNKEAEEQVLKLRDEVERLKRMAKKRKVMPKDWADPTLDKSAGLEDAPEEKKEEQANGKV